MSDRTEILDKPLMTPGSRHHPVESNCYDVDNLERVETAIEHVQEVLEKVVRPLIDSGDSRVEVRVRNRRRIGVWVDEEIVEEVWAHSGVHHPAVKRAVSSAHTIELRNVVDYTYGGEKDPESSSDMFILKNLEAEEPYAAPINVS